MEDHMIMFLSVMTIKGWNILQHTKMNDRKTLITEKY